MSADLTGKGTPEQVWQAWPTLHSWPLLRFTRPPATVVAVAPHPDDEVLGVGGLLALLAQAGSRIHIIAVTDGEASHPKSPTLTPKALAARRVAESTRAREALGLRGASVERLGLPDGDVHRVEAQNALVTAAVLQTLARTAHLGPAWCLAPFPRDGHPDHDSVGQAAVAGARGTARVLTYPVWMWHWAAPGDPRVPWPCARRVVLPAAVRAAKQAAVEAFQTQISPLSGDPADATILPPHILTRLTRSAEIVFATDET